MRRKLLTPLVAIFVAAVGGLAGVLAVGWAPALGLDLQGGISVVLEPTQDVTDDQLDQAISIIRTRVDALGVAEPEITRQGDAIVVQLPGVEDRERALETVGQTAELRFRPVLQAGPVPAEGDGGGGGESATTTTAGDPGPGDTTATTAPAGDETTTTSASPSEDTAEDEGALGLAPGESAAGGRSALRQQETTTTTSPEATTTTAAEAPATTAPGGDATTTTLPQDPAAQPPQTPEPTPPEEDQADAEVVLDGKEGEARYQLGPTLATGRLVETASAQLQNGQWMVALTMKGGDDGINRFNEIAAQCVGGGATCPTGQLAIVLDSVVQSAPTIQQASFNRDEISITGDFDEDEAKDLALVLRYGSLPVELERQTVQTVSASLGDDSLQAGVIAAFGGLGLVALYMLVYYRALGAVVIVGFGVWGSLMFVVISWLGETQGLALTLSGVTGMIMSIGVTVDSYVVFFERLKDDVRAGRTLRSTTERSFRRAFRTILAANVTSFIGAAVLWWLTVGSVRGFALFLGLSTVLGVVVTWFFTRPMVIWLSRHRVFTDMPRLGVARGLAAPSSAKASGAQAPAGGTR